MELIFTDLEILEKRLSKLKQQINNDKEDKVEYDILKNEKSNGDKEKLIKDLNLFTDRKIIFAINIS